jgi:hypothetical protein
MAKFVKPLEMLHGDRRTNTCTDNTLGNFRHDRTKNIIFFVTSYCSDAKRQRTVLEIVGRATGKTI